MENTSSTQTTHNKYKVKQVDNIMLKVWLWYYSQVNFCLNLNLPAPCSENIIIYIISEENQKMPSESLTEYVIVITLAWDGPNIKGARKVPKV